MPADVIAYLVRDRQRRIEAASVIAASVRLSNRSTFRCANTMEAVNALRARWDRVERAALRVLDTEVAYRQVDSEQHRRAHLRACVALMKVEPTLPERDGVELAAYVEAAKRAPTPVRMAVADEYMEHRWHTLLAMQHESFVGSYVARKNQGRSRIVRRRKLIPRDTEIRTTFADELSKRRALKLPEGPIAEQVGKRYGLSASRVRRIVGGPRKIKRASS